MYMDKTDSEADEALDLQHPLETTSDQDPEFVISSPGEDGGSSDSDSTVQRKTKTSKKKQYASTLHPLMNFFTKKRKEINQNQEQVSNEASSSITSTVDTNVDDVFFQQVESSSMLDGKYFKVVKHDEAGNIEAACQLCLPLIKNIKGKIDSSSNYFKHLKRLHPTNINEYEAYKKSKKETRRKRTNDKIDKNDVSNAKQGKMIQPSITSLVRAKSTLSQSVFEERITNFVVNTMSAISIVEHESFLNIFDGMNLKVPTRKTLIKRISDAHEHNMQQLKTKIKNLKYICSTADIWSNKKRSFLGVTIHWIEEDFSRGSAAIACKRFKGVHSYRNIAEMLEEINLKFFLTEDKLIGTVTDNGSNFVKAFKEFGQAASSASEEEDDLLEDDDGIFRIVNLTDQDEDGNTEEDIENMLDIAENTFVLPKHMRCASHTLNLIATTDYRNTVKKNPVLRTREMNAFHKCGLLWKKANRPKSSEIIQQVLGHTLSSPGTTRWNSTYDSVSQIVKEKEKLPVLFAKLGLETFKEIELLYLEEYSVVMKPLADTLDLLQGESNTFFGLLLPSLASLLNKYEKMASQSRMKYGGEHLIKMCIHSLKNRFSDILNLSREEPLIAAVLLPQFKLRWYNVIKNPQKTVGDIKRTIITWGRKLTASESSSDGSDEDEQQGKKFDDFFDFDGDININDTITITTVGQNVKNVVDVKSSNNTSKIELELLRYLEDKRSNMQMLNEYPVLKKLSIKYNTCLPSSAPVERLFSFATMIDSPRRNALSDDNFETLVLTKANSKKHNK